MEKYLENFHLFRQNEMKILKDIDLRVLKNKSLLLGK